MYDLKNVIDSISHETSDHLKQNYEELVKELEDVFLKNQWDIGRCDAVSHKIDVVPGSKPIKLPNTRIPMHYKRDLMERLMLF